MIELVTGGSGLTGRALVDALLAEGRQVRVLDLVAHPDPRVESIVGDVCDPVAVAKACAGVDTVFHTAAVVSQHPAMRARMEAVNVGGTAVLLEASRIARVPRFVFTSSIDVVFSGAAIANGDETLPYARRFLDDYGRTKAEAEQLVLAADGLDGLRTVALRAAGIFGPHDRNRFPVLLDYVRRHGFLAMGNGKARFSHVYVDNLVHAHLLAARALGAGSRVGPSGPTPIGGSALVARSGDPAGIPLVAGTGDPTRVAGRAYFVTDHAPQNFFDFVEPYLRDLGIRRMRVALPRRVAWGVAHGVEATWRLLGERIPSQPVLTRYTVAATCRDFWFHHAAATADFGYSPVVSADEAYQRTLAWLRELPRPA